MDSDEREICSFLRACAAQWISGKEICRRVGGRRRYLQDPHWAYAALSRMVESGVLEVDATRHYRLKPVPID